MVTGLVTCAEQYNYNEYTALFFLRAVSDISANKEKVIGLTDCQPLCPALSRLQAPGWSCDQISWITSL